MGRAISLGIFAAATPALLAQAPCEWDWMSPPGGNLPGGQEGVYGEWRFCARGYDTTCPVWSIVSGTTPPGLVPWEDQNWPPTCGNTSSLVLRGTPSLGGSYTFTVEIFDCHCFTSLQTTYFLDIGCVATIGPPALPAASLGQPYSVSLTATPAGTYTFSVASGTLPPGLSLLPAGVLEGTPTGVGTFSFAVEAVEQGGCRGLRNYTVDVGCVANVEPPTLPSGSVGSPYGVTLVATPGGGYTFTLASGALPPGLVLDPAGLLAGTPTRPGTYAFGVAAATPYGCIGSRSYVVAVDCAVDLQPDSLLDGHDGSSYLARFQAVGGFPPQRFVVSAGVLPPGLALQGSGVLSGTPTAEGSFAFTVSVRDASCEGSRDYVLAVRPAIAFFVGQGLGQPNPNRVRIHDRSGRPTAVDLAAYAAGRWGCNVSTGDIDASQEAELLTGPGPGETMGPQVRAFTHSGVAMAKVSFFAYGTLAYGVNVASGTMDSDPTDEILTGPGPGAPFGPQVRGWNYDGVLVAALAKVSFFAYGTLAYGVNVAAGDLDLDRFAEIVAGAGPSPAFGSIVRGFDVDGGAAAAIPGINYGAFPTTGYGVNVAAGDVDGDRFDDMLVAMGPGPPFPARFLAYQYDGAPVAPLPLFDVVPGPSLFGGRVGAGELGSGPAEDLLTGNGRDPAASSLVRAYAYDLTGLAPLGNAFVPFPGGYGVNPASGSLGGP